MKNHFFFAYSGNKRNEAEKIVQNIDLSNIETIIEPFCGSCAVSYYISTLYPKKFKYIINDTDEHLINLLNIFKNKKKGQQFINKINKLCFDKDNKFIDKETYNKLLKNNDIYSYFIGHRFHAIRATLYPLNKKMNVLNYDDINFIKFLTEEKVIIKNSDGLELIKENINNEKAFIFIDPPYIQSCNRFYDNPTGNCYEYFYNVRNELKNFRSLLVFCLEDIWIIRLLFDNLKDSFIIYEKKYQVSKKLTNHILIINKIKSINL